MKLTLASISVILSVIFTALFIIWSNMFVELGSDPVTHDKYLMIWLQCTNIYTKYDYNGTRCPLRLVPFSILTGNFMTISMLYLYYIIAYEDVKSDNLLADNSLVRYHVNSIRHYIYCTHVPTISRIRTYQSEHFWIVCIRNEVRQGWYHFRVFHAFTEHCWAAY